MTLLLRIAERAINRPLLIEPTKAALIVDVLSGRLPIGPGLVESRVEAQPLPAEAQEILTPDASRFTGSDADHDRRGTLPYRRTADGVAVVSIVGSLVNRGAWIGAHSGIVSYEGLKAQLAAIAADEKAHSCILDIESAGGEAVGAMEAAAAVRSLAAQKPVTAIVNGMAASAAYALASGATRIVTTPTGLSGSIGVVLLHADFSRQLDAEGVTPTLIFAGAHKADANPFEPLTGEAKTALAAEVATYYDLFVDCVAAGRRKLSPAAVRATEARAFIGDDAVRVGLADSVGTFESALADLSRAKSPRRVQRERDDAPGLTVDLPSPTAAQASLPPAAMSDAEIAAERDREFAEGFEEGRREGRAEGRAAGQAAEDERWRAILLSSEAAGREQHAAALAEAGLSPEKAKAALVMLPRSASFAFRTNQDTHDD